MAFSLVQSTFYLQSHLDTQLMSCCYHTPITIKKLKDNNIIYFLNKYNHMINIKAFRTLPVPAMISLLVNSNLQNDWNRLTLDFQLPGRDCRPVYLHKSPGFLEEMRPGQFALLGTDYPIKFPTEVAEINRLSHWDCHSGFRPSLKIKTLDTFKN